MRSQTDLHGSYLFLAWLLIVSSWRTWLWRQRLKHRQCDTNTTESTHTRMKQTLLFIRHGQTSWNVEHRLPGQLPGIALNDAGREQAARLAEALSVLPISTIVTSPLERAYDTASLLNRERNLPLQLDPDLMDTNIGHWAGQSYHELNKSDESWKSFVHNPTVAPEDVETFPQVQNRAVAAVERWRKRESSGLFIAFVAHADVVKLLVAHYSGLDTRRAGSIMIDNASVSIVELEEEHPPRVVSIGWNPKPGWLKAPTPAEAKEGAQHAAEKLDKVP